MNWVYKIEDLALRNYRKKFYTKSLKNKKVPPPLFILWDCTRRCNLHCEHCGATKEKYQEELSTNKIKEVLRDLASVKTEMFAVTGGEPLLRKDLFDIFEYAHQLGLSTGIASNGFFIDKQMAEKIRGAHVASMQISLDGLEETHNSIRGNKESFSRAVQAIKFLKKKNIPIIQVATTITKTSFDELEKIRDLLIEIGVERWRIGIIMPIGRAENSSLSLSADKLKALFDFVKNNDKSIQINIGENLPFLAEYEEIIRDRPSRCPVGITACCIGVSGNIRGCAEQPDTSKFIEGNVKEKPLSVIWQEGFKKYRLEEILLEDEKCKICKVRKKCLGGCWVMREGGSQCIYDLLGDMG